MDFATYNNKTSTTSMHNKPNEPMLKVWHPSSKKNTSLFFFDLQLLVIACHSLNVIAKCKMAIPLGLKWEPCATCKTQWFITTQLVKLNQLLLNLPTNWTNYYWTFQSIEPTTIEHTTKLSQLLNYHDTKYLRLCGWY